LGRGNIELIFGDFTERWNYTNRLWNAASNKNAVSDRYLPFAKFLKG